jgi:hypothetical protein
MQTIQNGPNDSELFLILAKNGRDFLDVGNISRNWLMRLLHPVIMGI